MKKPNNYENTQVQGEFTPVELGGHKLVIKKVEERMSKTNRPMIVVYFDFAPGDKQAGSNVSVNVQNQNREFDYEKFGRAAADAMIAAGIGFKCDEREFARLIKDLIDYV